MTFGLVYACLPRTFTLTFWPRQYFCLRPLINFCRAQKGFEIFAGTVFPFFCFAVIRMFTKKLLTDIFLPCQVFSSLEMVLFAEIKYQLPLIVIIISINNFTCWLIDWFLGDFHAGVGFLFVAQGSLEWIGGSLFVNAVGLALETELFLHALQIF